MDMKISQILIFSFVFTVILSFSGMAFGDHPQTDIKGTVAKIAAIEYEVTLKDDKGKETKVKVKDIGEIKVGDSVVVSGGKIKKAVKPVTGGY
jgi:hypothetical protein